MIQIKYIVLIITLGIAGCSMSKKNRASKLEFLIDYPRQGENGLVEGRFLLLFSKHCWNGDQKRPNALSRLRYNQMFIKNCSAN